MRSIALTLCITLWGASAFAATKGPDLGVDFSHAAVKYLMVVGTYESSAGDLSSTQERIDSAYKDMMAAATGDQTSSERKTALLLKIFAAAHIMNVKTYQLTRDQKEVAKDKTCISDWKQTLQSRDSNQPEACR